MNTIFEIQTQLIALQTQGVSKEQHKILDKIWESLTVLTWNSYETKKEQALHYIYEGALLIKTHHGKHGRENYIEKALECYKKGKEIYSELPKSLKDEVRDEVGDWLQIEYGIDTSDE